MPQEGQSGKSQGSDEFQPARRLAASVAPAPPRRLTSELQRHNSAARPAEGDLRYYKKRYGPGPLQCRVRPRGYLAFPVASRIKNVALSGSPTLIRVAVPRKCRWACHPTPLTLLIAVPWKALSPV